MESNIARSCNRKALSLATIDVVLFDSFTTFFVVTRMAQRVRRVQRASPLQSTLSRDCIIPPRNLFMGSLSTSAHSSPSSSSGSKEVLTHIKPTNNMQNRNEFIATGLVPVTNTSELPTDGCSICTDPFENPVVLPCKHVFCKECIVDWLIIPTRNTCPYCRRECFPMAAEGQLDVVPARRGPLGPERAALMSQALTLSGLENGEFSTFSDDISWDTASIARATASASTWLDEHTEVAGPAAINKRRLGHQLIAMGNLLRGYARASGRPYNAQLLGEWRTIIDILYKRIESRHASYDDAMILTWQLSNAVRLAYFRQEGGPRASAFIAEDQGAESPAGDLELLIKFVAFQASEDHARRRRRSQEIRDEPNVFARVGMRLQNVFRS